MARTCADTAALFEVLAGTLPNAPHGASLKGQRIGVIVEQEQIEMPPDARELFDNVLRTAKDAGAEVRRISVPPLANMIDGCVFGIVCSEASAVHARWIKERPEDYAPMTRQQLEMGFAMPAVHYLRLQQYRRYLVSLFVDVWKQVDALISPIMPWVSPHEDLYFMTEDGGVDQRGIVIALEMGLLNLTGQPGLAFLSGFNHENLPLSVQVITPPMQDELALGLGIAIENLLPATRSIPPLTSTTTVMEARP
jgi:aspartyl-tRNA(Asn)/glutamyl-tRNA(Gln) amidotransferase subunit A